MKEKIIRVLEKHLYHGLLGNINLDDTIESIAAEIESLQKPSDGEIIKAGMESEGSGDKYFIGIHYSNDWIAGAKACRDGLITKEQAQ